MLFIDKLPLQHLISWTFVPDKTGIRFRPDIRRNNPGHIPVPVHHPCLRQTNTKSKRKGSLFINRLHSPDLLDAGAAEKCRNQFSEISDNVASIFSGPFPFWRYRRNGYKQRKQHASKSGYPEYSKRAQSRTWVLARSERCRSCRMTLPSHRHGIEISAVAGASCLLLTYTTQYGRLKEHESRRDAGLAHDVIKTSDRGDPSVFGSP